MGPARLFFMTHHADLKLLLIIGSMIPAFIIIMNILNYVLRKRSITGKKALKINIAANVIFFLIFFIVAEYQATQFEDNVIRKRKAEKLVRDIPDIGDVFEIDLLLLWKAKKNYYSGLLDEHWSFTTDSNGIRSVVEIPYKKAKDEYRILVIGDSWVFGFGVNDDEVFCYRLENLLHKKYPDRKITVINGGCPAYCAAQGFIFLQKRGMKYNPDLVIVKGFLNGTVMAIFDKLYHLPSPTPLKTIKSTLWNSNLYLYIRRLVLLNQSNNITKEVEQIRSFDDFKYTRQIYGEIDDLCKKKKIPLIYTNISFKYKAFYSEPLKEFAEKRDVNYLEIELDMLNDMDHIKKDSQHPGPRNNKVIAQILARYIEEKGFIKNK